MIQINGQTLRTAPGGFRVDPDPPAPPAEVDGTGGAVHTWWERTGRRVTWTSPFLPSAEAAGIMAVARSGPVTLSGPLFPAGPVDGAVAGAELRPHPSDWREAAVELVIILPTEGAE